MKAIAAWLAVMWLSSVAQAQPQFAAASVKANSSPDERPATLRWRPGAGFQATNVTLRELVAFAYQRHAFDRPEVTGGPAWIDSERFDIEATAVDDHVADADGTPRRSLLMLQSLLAAQFGVKVREEKRDRPVYVLAVAAGDGALGPRIRRSNLDCSGALKDQPPLLSPGQGPPCSFKTPPGRLVANTFSMAMIASLLSRHLDRLAIDGTGLDGLFDIELEASDIKAPPNYRPGPSDLALPPAAGPSIFVAVREQLGLKLEPQSAPVGVVVIDAAERPVSVPRSPRDNGPARD